MRISPQEDTRPMPAQTINPAHNKVSTRAPHPRLMLANNRSPTQSATPTKYGKPKSKSRSRS
eukprot:11189757-Lingulodinium_polyedra.AAC.1